LEDHEIRKLCENFLKGSSGADIECLINEAIYNAIRDRRAKVIIADFMEAISALVK
jgi:ATP-dependent 26S proteasome regulatory subunit